MCVLESDYECYCETRTTYKTARVLKNAAGSDQIENSCNIFSSVSKEANPCKKAQPPTLQDVEGHRVSSSHGLLWGRKSRRKSSIREDTAQKQHSSTRLESQDVWKACLHTRNEKSRVCSLWITYLFLTRASLSNPSHASIRDQISIKFDGCTIHAALTYERGEVNVQYQVIHYY